MADGHYVVQVADPCGLVTPGLTVDVLAAPPLR